MKLGLVILNYNDFNATEKLLNAIKNYDELDKICVVDNKSTDDSYEKLLKFQSDKISVIQSPKNGGYSYGNNIGVKYLNETLQPDIIGISNPDVYFDNDFIKTLKQLFSKYPDYAIITGLQVKPNGEIGSHPFWEEITTFKAFWAEIRNLFSPVLKIFTLGHYDKTRPYKNYLRDTVQAGEQKEIIQTWAVEGSLFFIRSEDFERVGFFDDRIFLYGEEDILATKLKRIGRKVGVCTKIKYTHFHYYNTDYYTSLKPIQIWHRKTRLTRAKIFIFDNYTTESKTLHILYNTLTWISLLEEILVVQIPRKIKGMLRPNKQETII